MSDGYTQLPPDLVLSKDLREDAAQILGFDIFVHNVDRRTDNHNLYVDRNGFLVFDHDQAFSFLLPLIGAPPPESDPALAVVEQHVFYRAFGQRSPDFTRFRQALGSLADDDLDAVAATVPDEWTTDRRRASFPGSWRYSRSVETLSRAGCLRSRRR